MKPLLDTVLFGCFFLASFAWCDGSIVQVSRKLRLSSSEPLPPKDFQVNLGVRDGVQVGDLLTVRRTIAVRDMLEDGQIRLIPVLLGSLKVLAVGETSAIARENAFTPIAALPSLQYTGFLVGDAVIAKTGLPLGSPSP